MYVVGQFVLWLLGEVGGMCPWREYEVCVCGVGRVGFADQAWPKLEVWGS